MGFHPLYRSLSAFVRQYDWVYRFVGIAGNSFFVIGTILFLNDSGLAGWFFLAGSLGMLVDSLGSLLAKAESEGRTALTYLGRKIRYEKNHSR